MTPDSTQVETQTVGVVSREIPPPKHIQALHVLLIKPSKYDDDGYVMRYVRGVLPSNTLHTLAGLTRQVLDNGELGEIEIRMTMMDEHVQKIEPRRLLRRYGKPGVRVVAALCGVQTNQFPRAADLARQFHQAGAAAMIGGFHVSGAIAMCSEGLPPECRELLEDGVTLVKGEVEMCWGDLLRDALHGRLQGFYDVTERPDLDAAAIPEVDPKLMKRYAYPFMGTIDAGRGCPFNCSFCTIINVQGRQMRCRSAHRIMERIRVNYADGIDFYFFTDDNFSRNPNWKSILDAFIELRETEGLDLEFMMQVDTLAYRIPGFVEKAARAGCSQVFVGMESVDPENLKAAGKPQNHVGEYQEMVAQWHARNIVVHVGYIIGFPNDTVENVREAVRRLREDICVDQVSFFMLTPLPGSEDHARMVANDQWMDTDYNRFDSFHPVQHHPRMSGEQWMNAYCDAWREFYTVDSMKSILSRATHTNYWGIFKNMIWYKYSAIVESTHPMICGFFRLKDRLQRRPGYAPEGRWVHLRRRIPEVVHTARGCWRLYLEMQEVWLATRGRAQVQANIAQFWKQYEDLRERMGESRARASEKLSQHVADMRTGAGEYLHRAGQAAEHFSGRLSRIRPTGTPSPSWLRRLNPFAVKTHTRMHLNEYWRQTWHKLRRGRLLAINPVRLTWNFLRDIKLFTAFNISLIRSTGLK